MEKFIDSFFVFCGHVGTRPGSSNVQNYHPISIYPDVVVTATANLSRVLEHGARVYSTVVCFNRGGLASSASSDGVTVLLSPPSSDNAYLSVGSPVYTAYTPQGGYLPSPAVSFGWGGFWEPAGTPLLYQVRVLEGGEAALANWTSVSFARTLYVDDLRLPENVSHTIQIRAVNLGGVASPAVQSTFVIDSSPPEDTGT